MTIGERLHILSDERPTHLAEQGYAMLHGKYWRKAMCASINVENKKQNRQKPPRSVGRIVGEILAGAALGLAVAVPVAYVTEIEFVDTGAHFVAFPVLVMIVIIFAPLYGLGSAVGVYLVGNIGKQTGPFLLTLGCGLLGGLVMLPMLFGAGMLARVLIVGVERIVAWTFWVLILLVPPIIATFGFDSSRRCKEPPSS